jgi:hypothetical protein
MKLLLWAVAALFGVGTAAAMPRTVPVREIFVAEITGKPGGPGVGESDLPQSGGPELFFPAASVLLGMSILMYALLRRRV